MLGKSKGPDGGWLVKCDGCGKETLAEVFPDRVVVYDRRHGRQHIAVIPRCEILKIMGACFVSCVPEREHIAETETSAANN
ncbi:hypothetical protein ACFLUT_03310 [Chloroflexota bacterium]